ncbi:hypothetical protein [Pleionea sediminis]|uniref:hypothetical protein n=1 Tax=Pleionea sediminis TaxID=2569479 RepID=UPI001185B7DD|nr:hypothetical protein [Pleionea sediminis]
MFKEKCFAGLVSLFILSACSDGNTPGTTSDESDDNDVTLESVWSEISGVWATGVVVDGIDVYMSIEKGKKNLVFHNSAEGCYLSIDTELEHEYAKTYAWLKEYDYQEYLDKLEEMAYEGEILLSKADFSNGELDVKEIEEIWVEETELTVRPLGIEIKDFYYEATEIGMYSLVKSDIQSFSEMPICNLGDFDISLVTQHFPQ